MKLVVGLGNPGADYDNHKHNVGFWVVDLLAKEERLKWKTLPLWLETWWEKEDACLVKPRTWMNESGKGLRRLLSEKNGKPGDLIVIHDDLDLKAGKMKWDFSAGHGGHNGVRSIIDAIGSKEFYRLRFGIGRPPAHIDAADYVLQPFAGEELKRAEETTAAAVNSVKDFLKHGLQWVQNHYH